MMPFDYFPFSKNHNCYFKPPGIFCKIENHNNIIFNREKSGKSLVIISLFRPISASYFHEISLSLIFSNGHFFGKKFHFPTVFNSECTVWRRFLFGATCQTNQRRVFQFYCLRDFTLFISIIPDDEADPETNYK